VVWEKDDSSKNTDIDTGRVEALRNHWRSHRVGGVGGGADTLGEKRKPPIGSLGGQVKASIRNRCE